MADNHAGIVLALCGLVLSLTACGVPYDPSPQSLPGALPSQLTRSNVSQPQNPPVPSDAYQATFYFVVDGLLVPFNRKIAKPATLLEVLQVLEHGPLDGAQNGREVGSDIPINSQLAADGFAKGGEAKVGLDLAYYQLPNTEQQILELAQIVYTLEETLPQVHQVLFLEGSQLAVIVNGSGETVSGRPVDETTYCLETRAGCAQPRSGHQTS